MILSASARPTAEAMRVTPGAPDAPPLASTGQGCAAQAAGLDRLGDVAVRHERRGVALERFEQATELPLLVLALAMVPLLVLPLIFDLPSGVDATFLALDWFIWAAFAFEYIVRLALSHQRWRFVRREWPDLLIIVLPFLRPLRIVRSARALRLLRMGRLAAVLGELGQERRTALLRRRINYILVVTLGLIVLCAALTLAVEEDGDGSIDSYGDALWWAVTTVTTVGYGDTFPVTAAGRGIAAFLMLSGIALFGVITANIAAFFVSQEERQEETLDPVAARLDEVLERLRTLEELQRHTPP